MLALTLDLTVAVPDPKLPFVHLGWSEAELVEFFNRHVMPAVRPGHEVAAVKQERLNWTPGQECVATYALQSTDRPETPPQRAVVTFSQEVRSLANIYARQYDGHSGISDENLRPALFLPEYRCLVEFFPYDWKLPSLARAMSPDEMLPLVAAALPNDMDPQRLHREVSVLGYRPHKRCVLNYRVQGKDGDEPCEVIGKMYRDAARAATSFANQRCLHAAVVGRDLIIPRPFALAEEWNLVLMERARGTRMKELLRHATDRESLARTAAAALATLHSLPFDGGKVRSLRSELTRVRRYAAALHLVAPELASRAEAVLDRVGPLTSEFECARPCFIHCDLSLANVLVNGASTSVIDFDGACLGDPAIDVGNFMAELRREAWLTGNQRLRALCDPFLAEYQARTGAESGLAERAHVYCGFKLVEIATREFTRAPYRDTRALQSSLLANLLEEATTCLERL